MQNFLIEIIINFIKKIKRYSVNKLTIILAHYIILKSRSYYDKIKLIEDSEIKIFSQNGEDGIIDFIVQKLNLKKPSFIEIGVGDYSEANTRLLYEMYYGNGLIIDVNKNLKKKVAQNVNLWKGNLNIIEAKVSSKNINSLLNTEASFPIDFFSIDIDSIDYWVINELKNKISKVFILEYNPIFGSKLEISVPNDEDFLRKKYYYSSVFFGASLMAYVKLMDRKGYYLLGVNRLRNNAFFINKDYKKNVFFPKISKVNLKEATNFNYTTSRNVQGVLDYLNRKNSLNKIINLDIIDLSKGNKKKTKLETVLSSKY